MNTVQIDYASMTDAELTRAVAERAGWSHLVWLSGGAEQGPGLYCTGGPRYGHKLPDFSTDIGAAMGLIEDFGYTIASSAERAYFCRLNVDSGRCVSADRGTLPRVICLAYLAATETDRG